MAANEISGVGRCAKFVASRKKELAFPISMVGYFFRCIFRLVVFIVKLRPFTTYSAV